MDCAEKIFAEKGYDKASVREITAAANVNLARYIIISALKRTFCKNF
ncbi:MAG: hypothetical protein CM15mP58_16600 [Burkholderiaceae bacterium]|nr:MAG: hypothetical protein CM15mP58_16600 [Burkholderiaceae bacterium]